MAEDSKNTVTRLHVRVTPRASHNEVTGFTDDVLYIRVAALPDRGRANRELIDYLSLILGVSKTKLHLLKGHTSRNKIVAIDGLSPDEIKERLPGG